MAQLTDEEREEIRNNPVLTGEDELGGKPEQGATAEDVNMFLNDPESYPGARDAKAMLDREAAKANPSVATSGDQSLDDADVADINDTVHMQTGGKAGVEGLKSREMQTFRDSHMRSVGDVASGGGTVTGTGMRLADDRSWEARYNAMQARKRAERAGLKAQSMARQELLDTGRYFDDGRGNIRLKKSERQQVRRDSTRRGWHMDTVSDGGSAGRTMAKAGQDAYNASLNGWQDALDVQNLAKRSKDEESIADFSRENLLSMKRREEEKKTRYKRNAADNWTLFGGIAAALDDLNDGPDDIDGRMEDELINDKSKPARREAVKDANGAIVGYRDVYDKKSTGLKWRNGYVDQKQIQAINDSLNANGNTTWRLKGIVAQRKFNPEMPNQKHPTTVLVNGIRFDRETGQNIPFQRRMTLDMLYDFAVKNGGDAGIGDAEDIVAGKLDDMRGYLKKKGAPTEKERIASARNATNMEIARLSEAGRNARNDANLQQKRMELAGRLVSDYAKLKSTSASDVNMARNIPEAAWKALFAPKVMRDEAGNPVLDEATGSPMTEPIGEEEVFERMKLAGDWMKENFGRSDGQSSVDGLLNFIRSMTGEAETAQPQGAATQVAQPSMQYGLDGGALLRQMRGGQPPAAQGGQPPPAQSLVNGGAQQGAPQGNRTLEELLRKRGYDPAKIAAAARGGERTQTVQGPDVGQEASSGNGEPPPSRPAREPELSREEALAAEEERRARNGRQMAVMREAAQLPTKGSEETVENLWGENVIARFRKNHPDASDEDILSGRFDPQLRKIGKALYGDEYQSVKDKNYWAERDRKFKEEEEAKREKALAERDEREKIMTDREKAVIQKARDLFGDLWEQADNWAVENHGQGLIFKDSYETARAKKFNELVEERAKQRGLQLSNIYKSGKDIFGSYNPAVVFDEAFGNGAGTYFGRGHSAQQGRFSRPKKT